MFVFGRFRGVLADPLVREENPKLAEEIDGAKLRREKEMHAACNVVAEFKRNACAGKSPTGKRNCR